METQRLKQLFDFHEKNPEDTFVVFALAQELLKKGDLERSEEFFNKLLRIDEKYGGAYYHLGKLYEKKGEMGKAVKIYKKGIDINSTLGDQHAVGELNQALLNIDEDAI